MRSTWQLDLKIDEVGGRMQKWDFDLETSYENSEMRNSVDSIPSIQEENRNDESKNDIVSDKERIEIE